MVKRQHFNIEFSHLLTYYKCEYIQVINMYYVGSLYSFLLILHIFLFSHFLLFPNAFVYNRTMSFDFFLQLCPFLRTLCKNFVQYVHLLQIHSRVVFSLIYSGQSSCQSKDQLHLEDTTTHNRLVSLSVTIRHKKPHELD